MDVHGDLLALQSAKDDATVLAASKLFIKKYKARSLQFAEYFESQRIQKNCNKWYEGAAVVPPFTNNGLE